MVHYKAKKTYQLYTYGFPDLWQGLRLRLLKLIGSVRYNSYELEFEGRQSSAS